MTTKRPEKPLPEPTHVSEPFWDGCKRGVLLVQKCCSCGSYVFIPEPFCTSCLSLDLSWVESTGNGTVYSFSVVWRPQQPTFEVPYVVAIVEVDETWHMLTNIVDCNFADVTVGMPVKVKFEKANEEITLPYFAPAIA